MFHFELNFGQPSELDCESFIAVIPNQIRGVEVNFCVDLAWKEAILKKSRNNYWQKSAVLNIEETIGLKLCCYFWQINFFVHEIYLMVIFRKAINN